MQEEEVLGKAYDSRLMKRLLGYLRPYKWQVVVALTAIILKATVDVLGPYLTKVAIDKYLSNSPDRPHSMLDSWLSHDPLVGIGQIALVFVTALAGSFDLEHTQPYLLQWAGQEVQVDLVSQV